MWVRRGNERWRISCVTDAVRDGQSEERVVGKLCGERFGMDLVTRLNEDGVRRQRLRRRRKRRRLHRTVEIDKTRNSLRRDDMERRRRRRNVRAVEEVEVAEGCNE